MAGRYLRRAVQVAAALTIACGPAWGDGMIVPIRADLRVRGQWAVKYHHVKIHVRDQVAEVHVDQAFVNVGKAPIEVEYIFPIPPGAGISKMTMIADGKELPGKLLKAEDARRIYEEIVRKKQDPALLEYVGYGLYKTSVFPLPPGKERRVLIRYTAECSRDRDLVTVHYPLNTEKFSAKPIDDVKVTVDIKTRSSIGPVYSPTHDLQVQRKSADHVVATYHVTKTIPGTDLQVLYQVGAGEVGATVISHRPDKEADGYFMLLVSPEFEADRRKIVPKDIVLVFDHSGSMAGRKIDQAASSLKWILKNLNSSDRFNVVNFSDAVAALFNVDLVDADADHVEKAVDLVSRMTASGGTNIHGALQKALSLLPADNARPAYILFVTDGKPTVGEVTDIPGIVKAAVQANQVEARLMCLGVGYNVNVQLLDKLSLKNRGLSEYVKENEPLEAKVSGLYAKIRNPVMTDLKIDLGGAEVHHLYPPQIGDLFDGQQIMLVGRYGKGGRHDLVVFGNYQGGPKAFEYPVELDTFSEDNANDYVERVWAMRRVGFLMDQIALNGEDKELIDELIALSRDYGIMTPYTSFLADEDTKLDDRLALREAGATFGMGKKLMAPVGEAGQRSAVARGTLRDSQRPQAAAPAVTRSSDGLARFISARRMIGNTSRDRYEAGELETVDRVRQAGNFTMYRRGDQWYTPNLAAVDVIKDAERIRTLTQFDDTYFALARANTRHENEILALQQPGEELLLTLRGQTYRILPAAR